GARAPGQACAAPGRPAPPAAPAVPCLPPPRGPACPFPPLSTSAGPFCGDAGPGALVAFQRRPDEAPDRLRLDEERVVAVERRDHSHLRPPRQPLRHLPLEIPRV